MKKFLLGTVGLIALGLAAPALAADMPARTYTKAPAMVAAYDWSGFYLGINGGWGSSHLCWDRTAVGAVALVPAVREGCHDASGGLVGGQIGYRWQTGAWVFGLEAQGDWADLSGQNLSAIVPAPNVNNRTHIDGIGLFTGQVGYAWNNVLWYVKGGGAVTHNRFDDLTTFALPAIGIGGVVASASETRWGGVVGTGLEVGFAPNWTAALEYDHLFMGNHNNTFVFAAPPTVTDNIRQDVDMVTARISYRWGGPVVAKY